MSALIYIATHTDDYRFPRISGYIPIFAGKALHGEVTAIQGDDTGKNISILKQPNFANWLRCIGFGKTAMQT